MSTHLIQKAFLWTVDTLTTSNDAPVNVSFSAFDAGPGIDEEECQIQYGFDANGMVQYLI